MRVQNIPWANTAQARSANTILTPCSLAATRRGRAVTIVVPVLSQLRPIIRIVCLDLTGIRHRSANKVIADETSIWNLHWCHSSYRVACRGPNIARRCIKRDNILGHCYTCCPEPSHCCRLQSLRHITRSLCTAPGFRISNPGNSSDANLAAGIEAIRVERVADLILELFRYLQGSIQVIQTELDSSEG